MNGTTMVSRGSRTPLGGGPPPPGLADAVLLLGVNLPMQLFALPAAWQSWSEAVRVELGLAVSNGSRLLALAFSAGPFVRACCTGLGAGAGLPPVGRIWLSSACF